jgi:glucose/mannose transport system substrate-binding protein
MFKRRNAYISGAILALVGVLLAGCGQPGAAGDRLVIISSWTRGDQGEGLNAMYEVFKQRHREVEINNLAENLGSAADAEALLASRMQQAESPDSFQVRAGQELIDAWVKTDQLEPVTFLFKDNGWIAKYPPGLIDLLSYNGEIWSVPVDAQRSNVLWYNKLVFADTGLKPPRDLAEFFMVAEALKAKGLIPLALGDKESWPATQLFESVLLGALGPKAYNGLWDGSTDWNATGVKSALQTFARMLDYINRDHATRTWDEAAQLVASGNAAMNVMGGWADYFFKSEDLAPNIEYAWLPAPGTQGTFQLRSDAFVLPKGAPDRDNAIGWLRVVGSKEGQDGFNPLNGSIPVRADADGGLYDEYQRSAISDLASDQIAPSLANGAAAPAEWLNSVNQIVIRFVEDKDVATAQQGLAQTCKAAEVCK